VLVGAAGPVLIDLLERALLAGLHGALNRAAADLQALNADLDRVKYVRLPVRRVRPLGDLPSPRETAILKEAGEPVLLVQYTDDDPAAAGPQLVNARLLLPGVGCVATASMDGAFSFDVGALARFVGAAEVAVLARPALG
jgi:hypothetical protein